MELQTHKGLKQLVSSCDRVMADQASLQELWLGGKAGCFSAREQLKAWALREAWRQNNEGSHGMLTWIAEKLVKIGGCRDVPARLEALCSADGGKLRK